MGGTAHLGWSTAWCAPCTMLRGCAASPGCCSGCSMVRSAAWVYQKQNLKQNCWREPRGAWREIDQGRRGGAGALCGL
eukprot:scaffold4766_cov115-Isochrysis_galbana.AAC.2